MFVDIKNWCIQAFLNNFWFERKLTEYEWEAVSANNLSKMHEIVKKAVSNSHTSIMNYIIDQAGMKQYLRAHRLGVNPSENYAESILTETTSYQFRSYSEYRMYKIGNWKGKWAVLLGALESGNFGIVDVMLTIPAILDNFPSEDFNEESLLRLSYRSFSKEALPILDILINSSLNIDINDYRFYTNGCIASCSLSHAVDLENRDLLNFLLKNGANVKFKDVGKGYSRHESPPLYKAVYKGLVWAVKDLLDAGADIFEINDIDRSVFNIAFKNIGKNTSEILSLLLKETLNLKHDDNLKKIVQKAFYTALKASNLQKDHLDILFEYYPDLYEESQIIGSGTREFIIPRKKYKGEIPKVSGMMSFDKDNVHIVCFPQQSFHPLYTSIQNDNVSAVEFFLEKGFFKLNSKFYAPSSSEDELFYNLPLHAAVKCHSIEIVQFLLKEGADMYLSNGTYLPLELVFNNVEEKDSKSSAIKIIQCFKKNGYDIANEKSSEGNTLLMRCIKDGAPSEILGFLIKESNINIKNDDGATALHIASEELNPDDILLLVTSGANLDITDNHNRTPLNYALTSSKFYDEEKLIPIIILLSLGYKLNRTNYSNSSDIDLIKNNDYCSSYLELLEKCERVFSTIKNDKGFLSIFNMLDVKSFFLEGDDFAPSIFDSGKFGARLDALEKAFCKEEFTGSVIYFYGIE